MLTIIDDDGAVSSKTLSTELNLSKVVVQVLAQNLHLVSKDNPVLLGLLTALDCHKTNLCASPVGAWLKPMIYVLRSIPGIMHVGPACAGGGALDFLDGRNYLPAGDLPGTQSIAPSTRG